MAGENNFKQIPEWSNITGCLCAIPVFSGTRVCKVEYAHSGDTFHFICLSLEEADRDLDRLEYRCAYYHERQEKCDYPSYEEANKLWQKYGCFIVMWEQLQERLLEYFTGWKVLSMVVWGKNFTLNPRDRQKRWSFSFATALPHSKELTQEQNKIGRRDNHPTPVTRDTVSLFKGTRAATSQRLSLESKNQRTGRFSKAECAGLQENRICHTPFNSRKRHKGTGCHPSNTFIEIAVLTKTKRTQSTRCCHNEALGTSPGEHLLDNPLHRPGDWEWVAEAVKVLTADDIRHNSLLLARETQQNYIYCISSGAVAGSSCLCFSSRELGIVARVRGRRRASIAEFLSAIEGQRGSLTEDRWCCVADTEDICIVERLFSSSLVAVVSLMSPRKLKVCHFKKGTEICNYSYSNTILAVKLNRAGSGFESRPDRGSYWHKISHKCVGWVLKCRTRGIKFRSSYHRSGWGS
ncbi:hypothetical protein PR048_002083 [Dryococelus australis]|uniref:Uncharacterized protein n=1 Tax=Dryococelus australis TaxID=614101 RepID=A0ABQ9ILR9_9NEOP|nr:hypothetical protein PR048_002083 [Dryococelus australis]